MVEQALLLAGFAHFGVLRLIGLGHLGLFLWQHQHPGLLHDFVVLPFRVLSASVRVPFRVLAAPDFFAPVFRLGGRTASIAVEAGVARASVETRVAAVAGVAAVAAAAGFGGHFEVVGLAGFGIEAGVAGAAATTALVSSTATSGK